MADDLQWWTSAHNVLRVAPVTPTEPDTQLFTDALNIDRGPHWTALTVPGVGTTTEKHFTSTCSIWKPYTEPCSTACEKLMGLTVLVASAEHGQYSCATPHVSGQPDSAPNMTHPREIKRSCRHPVAPYPDVRYTMVSTPICLLSTDTGMGNPLTGSVYKKVESPLPLFVCQVPDPSAMAVDALSMRWKAL